MDGVGDLVHHGRMCEVYPRTSEIPLLRLWVVDYRIDGLQGIRVWRMIDHCVLLHSVRCGEGDPVRVLRGGEAASRCSWLSTDPPRRDEKRARGAVVADACGSDGAACCERKLALLRDGELADASRARLFGDVLRHRLRFRRLTSMSVYNSQNSSKYIYPPPTFTASAPSTTNISILRLPKMNRCRVASLTSVV
jgi:hypothetical protein